MAEGPGYETVTAPFSAIEPNVLIAGLEGLAVAWIGLCAILGAPLSPALPDEWKWYYLLYALGALLAVLLTGLLVEGLAGLVEILVTRHIAGSEKGQLRAWYKRATNPPDDWGQAQRWMWKSELASREFARRRTRLLVSRNTALCLILLTLLLAAACLAQKQSYWGAWLAADILVGAFLTLMFGWLWLSAHEGWHRAVRDAGAIGPP
jgi:MFS family permease